MTTDWELKDVPSAVTGWALVKLCVGLEKGRKQEFRKAAIENIKKSILNKERVLEIVDIGSCTLVILMLDISERIKRIWVKKTTFIKPELYLLHSL